MYTIGRVVESMRINVGTRCDTKEENRVELKSRILIAPFKCGSRDRRWRRRRSASLCRISCALYAGKLNYVGHLFPEGALDSFGCIDGTGSIILAVFVLSFFVSISEIRM